MESAGSTKVARLRPYYNSGEEVGRFCAALAELLT